MVKNKLKISIITPSFNQGQYIEDTIKSVLRQSYNNYEHIVIDGGSKDSTLEILHKYKHLKWISEKDSGQSNAINKGFDLADGNIIAWINSDDYFDDNAFLKVADHFNKNPRSKFVYGNITYVDKSGNLIKQNSGDNLSFKNLTNNPDIIRQPSCFWKKELLDECGKLDESLYLVIDLDLFLRFGLKTEFDYINSNLSFYRTYPETKTLSNQRKQILEIIKVVKKYNNQIPIKLITHFLVRYLRAMKKKVING